jgi:hypothetical protein
MVVKTMVTNLGLPSRVAKIFAYNRTVDEIRRIEEVVHGVIDSLLLFDLTIFHNRFGYHKLLLALIRKIFKVGLSSLKMVVSQWKDFSTYMYCQTAGSDSEPFRMSGNNIFKRLLVIDSINAILSDPGNLSKKQLESLAHLLSTRQMPAADKRAMKKSLDEFESNLTEYFEVPPPLLDEFHMAGAAIGRICRANQRKPSSGHISLANSGSYIYTVAEGGRAREILEAIRPILTHVPMSHELINLPDNRTLFCPAGKARWRYWCRKEPFLSYPEIDFGQEIPETLLGYQVYKAGFDESIGDQIVACALLEYSFWRDKSQSTRFDIPVRVLAVPEPGFKARIVTTCPWWVNVIQQSPGHAMRDLLSWHPAIKPGLVKTDQAWEFLNRLAKCSKPDSGSYILSSDLESATDLLPHSVIRSLVAGFQAGSGFYSELGEIALSLLVSRRLIETPDYRSFRSVRGILMGEPLTKGILAMYNCAVEHIARARYLKQAILGPVGLPKWHAFAVGGDDHIAHGPRKYLELITKVHVSAGTRISKSKHMISRYFIKYCEKFIKVVDFDHFDSIFSVNDPEKYASSPWVDSIKVRLLSPTTKTTEIRNDRNVAIGKGRSLGKTLRWLPKDSYPSKFVSLIRDRFVMRMGSLLPSRRSGVYWHLLLPEWMGGLDLWTESDLLDLTAKLPTLSRLCLEKHGTDGGMDLSRKLRKLLANSSYRSYEISDYDMNVIRETTELNIKNLKSTNFKDIKRLLGYEPGIPNQIVANDIAKLGYLTRDEIIDRVTRPFLFKEILEGKAKLKQFNTEALKRRYARIWDQSLIYDYRIALDVDYLRSVLTKPFAESMYFVGDTIQIKVHGQVREVDLIEEITLGLPSLKVNYF